MTTAEGYALLELPIGASRARVKQAYRNLARVWHPDLYPYDDALRLRCQSKMALINSAYEVLRGHAPEIEEEEAPPEKEQEPSADPVQEETTAPEPVWDGQIRVRDPHAPPPPKKSAWRFFRRQDGYEAPDYGGLRLTLFGFMASAVVMLSLFFLENPTSAAYYAVLRSVVPGAALYGAYFALSRGYWECGVALLLLALSLNPLIPIPMSVEEWRLFNIGCPVVLLFLWFHMYDQESSRG